MNTHDVINASLADLARDPILPPRIMDERRVDALCRSMAESGMAEPLILRRAPVNANGPAYFIVLGYRRYVAARRLNWDTVSAVVRDDLDDKGVLQLAFDADRTTQFRTPLENCWYYASMCAAGMTQAALAEQGGFSEAKASMYVRAGHTITPERIAEAGLVPEDLAGFGIVKLAALASPQGQVADKIRAAVGQPSARPERSAAFEWQEGRNGIIRATFRTTDVAKWSPGERLEFIRSVGPLLAQARRVEGQEDPAVANVRAHLEAAHRIALIEVRAEWSDQVHKLTELNTKLLLELGARRERKREDRGAEKGERTLNRFRQTLRRALRRFGLTSIIRGRSSIIEDRRDPEAEPQLPTRVDSDQAREQQVLVCVNKRGRRWLLESGGEEPA